MNRDLPKFLTIAILFGAVYYTAALNVNPTINSFIGATILYVAAILGYLILTPHKKRTL